MRIQLCLQSLTRTHAHTHKDTHVHTHTQAHTYTNTHYFLLDIKCSPCLAYNAWIERLYTKLVLSRSQHYLWCFETPVYE